MITNEKDVIVVLKEDSEGMNLLSKCVVICLEIITSFSVDGEYIPRDIEKGRMTAEEANELNAVLFGELCELAYVKPKKLEKMATQQILKRIRPAHKFIIGIYRNGTADYCSKSMRVNEKVPDEYILEQFAKEYKKRLLKGADYLIEFTNKYR